MNRTWAKIGSIAMTATLAGGMLAGCGGKDEESSASASTVPAGSPAAASASAAAKGPDISKKVELNWYLLGDAHPDQEKVVAEWNKMLQKDLNATVKLNFTTWTEWNTKYNLLLTSGEKIDMIFASSWADFYKFAKQGAFKDLTGLLPTYAPTTWGNVPKDDWGSATVGGKIYAVPNTNPEYTPDGFVYREDWRKELGTPEFKDLNSIEAYLDAVKTKKKVTPINGAAFENVNRLYMAWNGFIKIGSDVTGASSYDKPHDIVAFPFTQQFEDWVKKMKTWEQKGYWNKTGLADKTEAGDFIKTGQGAVYWRNPSSAGGFINDTKTKGLTMEIGFFPFTRFHNYVMPTLPMANGMAIPKSAPNPERSLMVLDKLRNDPAYFNLMTYGIEGTHWAKGEDEKHIVVPAPGVDINKTPRYDIASWGWRYAPMMKAEKGGWDGLDKLKQEFEPISKPDIFSQIYLDFAPVKTEQAAVNQVYEQYGRPLMLGLVEDVDGSLKTYRDKLKAAGIDKLLDYVKKESEAFYTEKGIK